MNNSLRVLTATIVYFASPCSIAASNSSASAGPGSPPARYVEGELLVRYKSGVRGPDAGRARTQMQHLVIRNFEQMDWQHVRLPKGLTVEQSLARYRKLPGVLAVEPNAIEQSVADNSVDEFALNGAADSPPSDPMFNEQYGLVKIGATNAWALTTGSTTVVIAIVGSGINYNHEDLIENMWHNPGEIPGNGIDDDENGQVDDIHGIDAAADFYGDDSDPMDQGTPAFTGTAVAGVVGAVGNNGLGLAGVSWSVQLMALRHLGTNNSGTGAGRLALQEYMIMMKRNGVNIRAAVGTTGTTSYSASAEQDAQRLADEGILSIQPAGDNTRNNDVTPYYPASFNVSTIVAVAASNASDDLWASSNYGQIGVDLSAPGAAIVTTSGRDSEAYYGSPGRNSTIYACGHVAGAAALLCALRPAITAPEIKAALLQSVDVLPAFNGRMVSNGRLNVDRALKLASLQLQLARDPVSTLPVLRFLAMSNITYRIEFRFAVSSGDWDLLADIPAVETNRFIQFVDNEISGSDSQRFYQVITRSNTPAPRASFP